MGYAIFCDSSVNFIIDRDSERRFCFAPLQGYTGQAVLRKHLLQVDQLGTLILVEGEALYIRSTAALHIARRLQGMWPLLAVLLLVPAFLCDLLYESAFWTERRKAP